MASCTKLKNGGNSDLPALINDMAERPGLKSEPPSYTMRYKHPQYATVLKKPNVQLSLDGWNNCYIICVIKFEMWSSCVKTALMVKPEKYNDPLTREDIIFNAKAFKLFSRFQARKGNFTFYDASSDRKWLSHPFPC
jgi:hypothetical protein